MKKERKGFYLVLILAICLTFLTLLLMPSVTAYGHYRTGFGGFFSGFDNIGSSIEQIGSYIGQILAPIIGPTETEEFLFAKVLLFFLLFAIIFVALGKIDLFLDNRPVRVILTLIVSIFAVRYIREGEFINAILLPYSALGIAISIFLPLLIYFYFVHYSGIGPFGRRTAWFIYFVVFLFLWGTRTYDPVGAGPSLGDANWIYLIGIGFILINILFDRTIHQYLGLAGLARWREGVEDARIANLQAEYDTIRDVDSYQARRRKLRIMRELRRYRADRW